MKFILAACLIATATAGRLENVYLPPHSAPNAGGSNLLSAPSGSGRLGGSAPGSPSGLYGAPAGGQARSAEGRAQTLRFDNNNDGLGSYSYQFETENKIQSQEVGQLKNLGSEGDAVIAQGSYSYTGPDGAVYTVTYIADENGFQATGDHLPTPPPIPEAILRSIELNAAEEAAGARSGGAGNGQYQGAGVGGVSRSYLAPNQPNSQAGYHY